MRKYASLLLIPSVMLAVSSSPALADGDTVKSVLGGMLGSIIVEGVKELNNQEQQQQQEQIQWQEPEQNAPAPVRQPVVSEAELKEIAYIKEVQGFLGKGGFYKGTTDGINGGATETAIRAWETEFQQTVDGKISDDELVLLKESANKGFSTKKQYEDAKAAGIEDNQAYSKKKAEDALLFLADAEEFLKGYKGDIDLKVITKDLKLLQKTKQGLWNAEIENAHNSLQKFFGELSGFNDFRKTMAKKRTHDENQRKEKILSDLKDIRDFSDEYLKNNITDDRAVELSQYLIDINAERDSGSSEEVLQKAYTAADNKISDSGLISEFQSWKQEKYPESAGISLDDNSSAGQSAAAEASGFWGALVNYMQPQEISSVPDGKNLSEDPSDESEDVLKKDSNVDHSAFPKCKSREALNDLQNLDEGMLDITEVQEVPTNMTQIMEFAVSRSSSGVSVEYKDDEKHCIAKAITSSGILPIHYVFRKNLGGVNEEAGSYYVQVSGFAAYDAWTDIMRRTKFGKG